MTPGMQRKRSTARPFVSLCEIKRLARNINRRSVKSQPMRVSICNCFNMLFKLLPYPMHIVITFLKPSKFYITSKNQRPVRRRTSGKVGGARLRPFIVIALSKCKKKLRVRDIRATCHTLRLARVQGNRQVPYGRIESCSCALSNTKILMSFH